ncbi:MAG: hypothetical protein NTV79_03540 [Candidatus Aureabacteria bacterium]|nr:hypothetical protein [Candidatus Auribacterota bacterium]
MKACGDKGFAVIQGGWLLVVVCLVLGMAYLWCHNRVVEASQRLKAMEGRRLELRERASAIQVHLEKQKSPAAIKARVEERRLDLVLPQPDQILRVKRTIDHPAGTAPVILSAARWPRR